jgi:hypothetical protein
MKRAYFSSRIHGSFLVAAIFFAALPALAYAQQEVHADGLWARGNTLVLLARFDQCGGPYRPVQPVISTDNGTTWRAEGPRVDGAELLSAFTEGDQLLIAGQMVSEGPSNSPFLLTYSFSRFEWTQTEIYADIADLLGMAREKDNGHLLSWVRHLENPAEVDSGPIVLHESVDGGKTWSEVKNVAHVPASLPGLQFFKEIPQHGGKWRISPAGNAVEESMDGKWHTRTTLPLPMQKQCPDLQDDTQP